LKQKHGTNFYATLSLIVTQSFRNHHQQQTNVKNLYPAS